MHHCKDLKEGYSILVLDLGARRVLFAPIMRAARIASDVLLQEDATAPHAWLWYDSPRSYLQPLILTNASVPDTAWL